jgi:YVTN family beta-propeller protein
MYPSNRTFGRPSRRLGPFRSAGTNVAVVAVVLFLLLTLPHSAGSVGRSQDRSSSGSSGRVSALTSPVAGAHFVAPATGPAPVGLGPSAVLATLNLVNNSASPGTITRTLNGQAPFASAYDTGKQRLYVGAYESKQVLVVDPTSRMVLDAVPVPGGPVSVVYDPAGNEIFVATDGSDSLTVIDDTLNAITASVPIPSGVANVTSAPGNLVYDALNQSVLVAQSGGSTCCTDQISMVDGVTNQVVAFFTGGPDLISLAYNDRNGLLYGLSAVNSSIVVVDVATGAEMAVWNFTFPGLPTGLTVDPTDGLVYVATTSLSDWANVTVISATFGTTVHNITVYQAGAFFGGASVVYSSATGKVYLSAQSVELFPITANTGTLGAGSALGSCVGEVTLTGSGAPLVAVDVCADSLLWLDGITGSLQHTTNVGADPVAAAQAAGSQVIAVAEYNTQRIDLLDGNTLTSTGDIAMPFGEFPTALTSDPTTGWLYGIDNGYGVTSVTAYDSVSGATMWTSPCSGCWMEGIADDNGTIFASAADTARLSELLYRFNATTGAASVAIHVATLPILGIYNLGLGGVVALPNSTTVVVSIPLASEVVAVNSTSGLVLWTDPTGNATGPIALITGTDLVALGTGGTLSPGVEFVNGTTGAAVTTVPLPSPPTSITPGGNGSEVYVLAGGLVYRVSSTLGGSAVLVTTPAGAELSGVFYLGASGGIAVPSRSFGAVYWVGATVNVTSFGSLGPTVQGEPLDLQVNVTGGYGPRTFAYSGLPSGCPTVDGATLSCLPLSSGSFTVGVTVGDSTGAPSATSSSDVVLTPFPLNVSVATVTGTPYAGGSVTLAVVLGPNQSAIAPFLNYSWSLSPASAGRLNNSTSSSVNVSFTAAGPASVALTTDLRGTTTVTYANFTVGTLGSSASAFGLDLPLWELAALVVGVVIVVVAVALVLRSRRPGPPPASEDPDDPGAGAEPVESAPEPTEAPPAELESSP